MIEIPVDPLKANFHPYEEMAQEELKRMLTQEAGLWNFKQLNNNDCQELIAQVKQLPLHDYYITTVRVNQWIETTGVRCTRINAEACCLHPFRGIIQTEGVSK